MSILRTLKFTALIALVMSLMVGCATPPPEQDTAKQAIDRAKQEYARAESKGYASEEAADLIKQAEEAYAAGDKPKAEELAKQALQWIAADKAIFEAKEANERAKSMGAEWRDTADIIAAAEKALSEGNTAEAIKLANKARKQAENAIAQKRAEEERLKQQQQEEASQASDTYTVARGDHLWGIAGKSEIYGNPYQWPLIYKANRDQIEDADLIFPGQNLKIERGSSQAAIDAAIQHARTRGAWSIGAVEQSDRNYLAQ